MYIYSVTNQITQQKYIGISLIPLSVRKQYHLEFAEQFKALMQLQSYLSMKQRERFNKLAQAFLQYGMDSFKWEVLEDCKNASELCKRQLYYITFYDSFHNGYNHIRGLDSIKYFEVDDSPLFHEEYDGKFKAKNVRGSANPNAKLSYDDVQEIKKLLSLRVLSQTKIAKKFGVAKSTISKINQGLSYIDDEYTKSSTPEPVATGRATGFTSEQTETINQYILNGQYTKQEIMDQHNLSEHHLKKFIKQLKDTGNSIKFKKPNPSLTDEQAREIKQLIQAGSMSQNAIAKEYGVSKMVIHSIRKGETYKHVVI